MMLNETDKDIKEFSRKKINRINTADDHLINLITNTKSHADMMFSDLTGRFREGVMVF